MKKQDRLFWLLQTTGWLVYLLLNLVSFWVRDNLSTSNFIRYLTATAAGFISTLILRSFYRRLKLKDYSVLRLATTALISSFAASNTLIWVSNFLRYPYFGKQAFAVNPTVISYAYRLFWWMVPVIGWSALYIGIKYWQEWNLQRDRTEKARALAQTAQLQMLRYRMNPHFLFNALNAIRALISEDKSSAKDMITELSQFLRYSLVSKDYKEIPLRDEIEAVRHFLNIQKMRYEHKLVVTFSIHPDAEEFPIPSFIVHPLAENAVKHGLQTSPLPLRIVIKAELVDGNLHIGVKNTGTWIAPSVEAIEPMIGTGLANVRQRLKDSYPGRHRLDTTDKDGYVTVNLEIRKK